MKISLNAIKKYVNITIPTDDLLRLIGSRLVEVEGTEDWSEKYKGITIVKVASCEKIPDTHLSLCQVFDGEKTTQVVCGAPNVHEGMLAVWLRPGCIVPETYGGENFELGVRKLRGYESSGMLAAADELGFKGGSHDGIVEIDPEFARPGDSFAEKFGLDDIILDIENKSLTHRPDTFGLIGFAREVAGILGQKFIEPSIDLGCASAAEKLKFMSRSTDANRISISISDKGICPFYSASVIDASKIPARSPYLTLDDIFLYKADMRPISPIVNLTNILMLETGQPLHAFDYDKFVSVGGTSEPHISVRLAEQGERLTLLDGTTIECVPTDILITSSNVPVALAGAMGGKDTDIDDHTQKIIIESATFSLYNLRKTQMEHGIFSEAITRFTKGQPASNCLPVLAEVSHRLGGEILDFAASDTEIVQSEPILVKYSDINGLLGTTYDHATIEHTLENVGFTLTDVTEESFRVVVPVWRTDIHICEDIIEEVGRLLGYDNIPLDFPTRPFIGATIDPVFALKSDLRHILTDKLHMREVLTYSFISSNLYEKSSQSTDNLYRIVNSLSPDLQFFRSSIIPSLMDKLRENENSGHDSFTLYEMNQVTDKSRGLTDEGVPAMSTHLGIVTLGDFYQIKFLVSTLLDTLGIAYETKPHTEATGIYEPLHSLDVYAGDILLCTIGEVKSSIQRKFKVKSTISAAELSLEDIMREKCEKSRTIVLHKFPSVSRDLTIQSDASLPFTALDQTIRSILDTCAPVNYSLKSTYIYQKSADDSTKNTTFSLVLNHPEKTLTTAEVSAIIEKISDKLSEIAAQII